MVIDFDKTLSRDDLLTKLSRALSLIKKRLYWYVCHLFINEVLCI